MKKFIRDCDDVDVLLSLTHPVTQFVYRSVVTTEA